MGLTFGYVYTMSFYQTWFHTYLVEAGVSAIRILLSLPCPIWLGLAANILGGFSATGWFACRGEMVAPGVGVAGLLLAAARSVLTFSSQHLAVIRLHQPCLRGITFQQPVVLTACLDIGGSRGGAVSGFYEHCGTTGGRAVFRDVWIHGEIDRKLGCAADSDGYFARVRHAALAAGGCDGRRIALCEDSENAFSDAMPVAPDLR